MLNKRVWKDILEEHIGIILLTILCFLIVLLVGRWVVNTYSPGYVSEKEHEQSCMAEAGDDLDFTPVLNEEYEFWGRQVRLALFYVQENGTPTFGVIFLDEPKQTDPIQKPKGAGVRYPCWVLNKLQEKPD